MEKGRTIGTNGTRLEIDAGCGGILRKGTGGERLLSTQVVDSLHHESRSSSPISTVQGSQTKRIARA